MNNKGLSVMEVVLCFLSIAIFIAAAFLLRSYLNFSNISYSKDFVIESMGRNLFKAKTPHKVLLL